MTQLVIGGYAMPEINKNRYSAPEILLGTTLTMADGGLVFEEQGKVWQVSASYNYIDTQLWRNIQGILRGGQKFSAAFLPDNGDELLATEFLVTVLTNPTFDFSIGGKGYWTGLAFTLREVRPHA